MAESKISTTPKIHSVLLEFKERYAWDKSLTSQSASALCKPSIKIEHFDPIAAFRAEQEGAA